VWSEKTWEKKFGSEQILQGEPLVSRVEGWIYDRQRLASSSVSPDLLFTIGRTLFLTASASAVFSGPEYQQIRLPALREGNKHFE